MGLTLPDSNGSTDKFRISDWIRMLFYVVLGPLAGFFLAYLMFCLLYMGWHALVATDAATSSRQTGRDPINEWASGITLMILFLPFALTGILAGLYSGVRLAFSETQIQRERKLYTLLSPAVRFLFCSGNRKGQTSLLLGLIVSFGWILLFTEPPVGIHGFITLLQVCLTLAGGGISMVAIIENTDGRTILGVLLNTVNMSCLQMVLY